MVTPAERGLESPTVGRACTLVQAERDAAATQVEKSMDEEKSMEGGGVYAWMVLRGAIGDMPNLRAPRARARSPREAVLVAATPRNRRAHLPRAAPTSLKSRGGGDPDGGWAAGQRSMSAVRETTALIRLDGCAEPIGDMSVRTI